MPQKELEIQYEECLYPELGQCHIRISHHRAKRYPQVMRKGKRQQLSRFIFEKYIGKIPKGLFILHRCDNRSCINPSHLYSGTHQDNMDDMIERGRARKVRGEEIVWAKLTEQQVREIRDNKNDSQTNLGKKYGVCQSTICRIKKNKTWRHVNI